MPGSKAKSRLVKNTAYLYALTFSSQIINLCTIPYQTRVLTPEMYGVVGFTVSLMNIFSLVLNFGFLYSATKVVAENSNDKQCLSKTYTAVAVIKTTIGVVLALILGTAIMFVPFLREYSVLVMLYYLGYFFAAMLPDYLYRGVERMGAITIRIVLIRLASAAAIFILLKSDSDVLVLPLAMIAGNLIAFAFCLWFDSVKLGVKFCGVSARYVTSVARDGFPYFVSRAAGTVYQSANAVILSAMYPAQAVVGWFNASDKVLSVVKQVSSPVADSIFPYMVKQRNYKLAIKLMVISAPIIALGCAALFVFADEFCVILFGNQYAFAGDVLRCLIPAMAVIFPTYIICFPVLVPMGLSNYANASTVIGMCVQLASLAILYFFGALNVYSLCLCASASEVVVFVFRLAVMVHFRDRMVINENAD